MKMHQNVRTRKLMPSWMVMKMPSIIMTMIQKTKNFTPDSASLEYDDDSEDDEKAEVESYDSELNEIIPDDDLDDVELYRRRLMTMTMRMSQTTKFSLTNGLG